MEVSPEYTRRKGGLRDESVKIRQNTSLQQVPRYPQEWGLD